MLTFSGTVDPSDLLANMDDQIAKAKEQASSRRDILDRVEKWQHATEEERWLDDYEKVFMPMKWQHAAQSTVVSLFLVK